MQNNRPFRVLPSDETGDGIMYVNHQKNHRSGHLGHALAEYAPGKIISYYSNNSPYRTFGHNGFGWVEYRRSQDGGQTWSDPKILEYSWETFIGGVYTISCEKAVVTSNNNLVLFCLRSDSNTKTWEPYFEPTYLISKDGGETYSEAKQLCEYRGRIYDARYHDGKIYALMFCNPATETFYGMDESHVYRLYISEDEGESFYDAGIIPFDTKGRGYGAITFLPDGSLCVYAYNINDEYILDYIISKDGGKTWGIPGKSYVAKRIRNPQVNNIGSLYFLFGRSGCVQPGPRNFVLYYSYDGITWSDGEYIREPATEQKELGGFCYYSNSLPINNRLLIQASDVYEGGCTNIKHWWIEPVNQ